MPNPFYLMTMPGLESLAFSELRSRIPDAEQIKFARGIALFRASDQLDELLALRTAEDVFFCLAHITGLGRVQDALRVLHSATLRADAARILSFWRYVHDGRVAKSWRVVSQMLGTHPFRRVDAGLAVSDALRKILPTNMRHVNDDADIEFWLWLGGSEAFVGLRLSDATMRHRDYKREHLPASLRPTVAASMAWLSRPTASDIVLDPLCGAGTILTERGLLSEFGRLLGSDLQQDAVAIARRNARAAAVEVTWAVGDARTLSLSDNSVTRILTNLPFGKQIGTHEENISLYAALSKEFARVLTPDGLMVTLTSEDRLWETVLRDSGWRIIKKVVCVVLGQPASIFVVIRE